MTHCSHIEAVKGDVIRKDAFWIAQLMEASNKARARREKGDKEREAFNESTGNYEFYSLTRKIIVEHGLPGIDENAPHRDKLTLAWGLLSFLCIGNVRLLKENV
jgi:hypothetical protein